MSNIYNNDIRKSLMLKILAGASTHRLSHLESLAESLEEFDIECKIVDDRDYDGYPSTNIRSWIDSGRKFKRLVSNFEPDAILTDRVRGFASMAAKSGIPTLVYLKADYWYDMEWAEKTTHKSFVKRKALKRIEKNADECLSNSAMILPICSYLEKIVNKKHPGAPTRVLQNFVDVSEWFDVKPMKLKHPCVGLLQNATMWSKTRELLLLSKILPKLPDVMFYWAGDGEFTKMVLEELKGFPNFKWLGPLEYPGRVREYLAGIDVYALISGMDTSGCSLLEAQLMKKIALATKVGGIPESVADGNEEYLIPVGDADKWVEKIRLALDDQDAVKKTESNKKFVEENFGVRKRAEDLAFILRDVVTA